MSIKDPPGPDLRVLRSGRASQPELVELLRDVQFRRKLIANRCDHGGNWVDVCKRLRCCAPDTFILVVSADPSLLYELDREYVAECERRAQVLEHEVRFLGYKHLALAIAGGSKDVLKLWLKYEAAVRKNARVDLGGADADIDSVLERIGRAASM